MRLKDLSAPWSWPTVASTTASPLIIGGSYTPRVSITGWILIAAWKHLETLPDTPERRLRMDALTSEAGGPEKMLALLAAYAEGTP